MSRRAAVAVSVVLTFAGLGLLLHGVATVLGQAAAELAAGGILVYGGFVAASHASPLPAKPLELVQDDERRAA